MGKNFIIKAFGLERVLQLQKKKERDKKSHNATGRGRRNEKPREQKLRG